ncbi:MAG: hypothetical protein HN996_02415, partial [Opitutae bacterium]|nr:hypothetical protein [Opitutae bacterium]
RNLQIRMFGQFKVIGMIEATEGSGSFPSARSIKKGTPIIVQTYAGTDKNRGMLSVVNIHEGPNFNNRTMSEVINDPAPKSTDPSDRSPWDRAATSSIYVQDAVVDSKEQGDDEGETSEIYPSPSTVEFGGETINVIHSKALESLPFGLNMNSGWEHHRQITNNKGQETEYASFKCIFVGLKEDYPEFAYCMLPNSNATFEVRILEGLFKLYEIDSFSDITTKSETTSVAGLQQGSVVMWTVPIEDTIPGNNYFEHGFVEAWRGFNGGKTAVEVMSNPITSSNLQDNAILAEFAYR